MESLHDIAMAIGACLAVLGLVIEAVGMIAVSSYRLRCWLPYKSPFELISRGCACMTLGSLIMVVTAGISNLQ